MKGINREKSWKLVLITTLFLLTLFGCEKGSPLSTLEAENQNQVMETDKNYGFNILKSKSQSFAKEFIVRKWIDDDGGTIQVGDEAHGISSLSFYEDSVDDDVLVTFWWESTGFLEGGSEFSPHGIQFAIPVKLELSYKDADLGNVKEKDLKIYYYNDDTGIWEALDSIVDKSAKTVTAYLEHFSRYAIGDTP